MAGCLFRNFELCGQRAKCNSPILQKLAGAVRQLVCSGPNFSHNPEQVALQFCELLVFFAHGQRPRYTTICSNLIGVPFSAERFVEVLGFAGSTLLMRY
jgi:hypothetical protein